MSAEQAQVELEETYGPEFFVITAWNPWCQVSTDEENLINNVELLIGSLNDSGFLSSPLDEISLQQAIPLEDLEAAKARVEAGGRAAYREAAGLLGRLARLDPKRAREAAWGLVRAYPRRRALREELAPLLGSPHEPHP